MVASITFAHEVGHNFDAQHTTSGIMSPALGNPPPTAFSSVSVQEITTHVNAHNSCLAVVTDNSTPTATPTPSPTTTGSPPATPTTVPAPTSTPDDGGGGNDPNDPNNPDGLALTASLKKNGLLKLDISVADFQDGCSVIILGALTSGKVYTTSAVPIATIAPTSGSFSVVVEGINRRTPLLNSKGRPHKLFLGVLSDCGGGVTAAPPKAIRPGIVATSSRPLSPQAWLRYLDSLL